MKRLSADDVSYTYQGAYQKVEALKHVSCEFESGKFYAIIGPSGCGKTTLLSLLAGLGSVSEGAILVDGKELHPADLTQHRLNNVSMIFQSFHLFPSLTVLENVCFPMKIRHGNHTEMKQKAEELLQEVQIPITYKNKFPAMLSGGEQQRVAIARALASQTTWILADEPTGNLDSDNSQHIIDLFKVLVQKGYCVIVVTHDLKIAKQADVVYHMLDGTLKMEHQIEEV